MKHYLKRQLLIASCIYLGQMLIGFSLGWTAPIIPKLQDPKQTPLTAVITKGQLSWIGSVLYIGTILGPYISVYLLNVKGRKPCMFLGGFIILLSFLVLGLAKNFAMLIVGRILKGIGIGILSIANIVYIGEIASTNIRGTLLTAIGFVTTLGNLIIYSVGPYVKYKITCYLAMTIAVVYLVGILNIPETPVLQVIKGRDEEAKKTLLSLGRENELDKVLQAKEEVPKAARKQEWVDIITIKSNRKALFITMSLRILQQMSGVVAMGFFVTSIFELAGSSIEPNIATIIIGVTQMSASTITPFLVERSGRKFLLLGSTALSSLSLFVLGLYFYLDSSRPEIVANVKWLPLVTLIIFYIAYDLGFGVIPRTLMGEMFTLNVRSTGSTVVSTTSWLVGFGISTAFGYMLTSIGGSITFWFFSGSCALTCIFTALFVPETKGKSLIEIQEMLER